MLEEGSICIPGASEQSGIMSYWLPFIGAGDGEGEEEEEMEEGLEVTEEEVEEQEEKTRK